MGKLPSTILRRPSLAAGSLPSSSALPQTAATTTATLHRPTLPAQCTNTQPAGAHQVRHATFVARPRRPYMFTQLVQLSDGSTFTVRTTSPAALYKSDKDTRNHMLWQPSEKSLKNVEVDEAGKLAAFRERFGNAWNLEGPNAPVQQAAAAAAAAKKDAVEPKQVEAAAKAPKGRAVEEPAAAAAQQDDAAAYDSLVDLISMYATEDKSVKGGLSAKDQARKEKSGKKK